MANIVFNIKQQNNIYTMPSFIVIHQTVWPQYTNVTDRTDNGPIAFAQ